MPTPDVRGEAECRKAKVSVAENINQMDGEGILDTSWTRPSTTKQMRTVP